VFRDVDDMQAAVVKWYAEFKLDTKKRLLEKLLQVFNQNPDKKSTRIGVVPIEGTLKNGLCRIINILISIFFDWNPLL